MQTWYNPDYTISHTHGFNGSTTSLEVEVGKQFHSFHRAVYFRRLVIIAGGTIGTIILVYLPFNRLCHLIATWETFSPLRILNP